MLGLKDGAAPMIRNSPLQRVAINYSLVQKGKNKQTNKQTNKKQTASLVSTTVE